MITRMDVCDAYYVFSVLFHTGQGSYLYGVLSRLQRMGYRPGLSAEHCRLTSEGARIVFRALATRHGESGVCGLCCAHDCYLECERT